MKLKKLLRIKLNYSEVLTRFDMPKIRLERDKCISCGACQAVCPNYWQIADDGKINLLGSQKQGENEILEVGDIACNRDAADTCPVQCIIIE